MATIQHRYQDTIYNYTTYDKTKILLNGEIRYFDTILTGITHPCSIMGDGISQISALPFQGIIKIESNANINLEVLRVNRNRITLVNTSAGNITVNLGTALAPDNEMMETGEIWEMRFNGTDWKEINKNYGNRVSVPVGGIIAWHKSLVGCPTLPEQFEECNGQVINDTDSPFDGQTLPDLNGDARFLRGGAVSGAEQDDAMQRITGTVTRLPETSGHFGSDSVGTGVFSFSGDQDAQRSISRTAGDFDNLFEFMNFDSSNSISPNPAKTDDDETRPINMSVVWVMRIK